MFLEVAVTNEPARRHISGNPSSAIKYFGTEDVIGSTFRSLGGKDYVVRAVYEDFPSNSHIHPNFIASSLSSGLNRKLTWDQMNYLTFLLIKEGVSVEQVEANMDRMVEENLPDMNL